MKLLSEYMKKNLLRVLTIVAILIRHLAANFAKLGRNKIQENTLLPHQNIKMQDWIIVPAETLMREGKFGALLKTGQKSGTIALNNLPTMRS
jgi:hypothetical protein